MTLRDLIDAGVPQPGAHVWAESAGVRHEGYVDEQGRIVLSDGRVAGSPSHAQKLATGEAKNGWRWWRTDRDGRALWLADLRAELVQRWRQQTPTEER